MKYQNVPSATKNLKSEQPLLREKDVELVGFVQNVNGIQENGVTLISTHKEIRPLLCPHCGKTMIGQQEFIKDLDIEFHTSWFCPTCLFGTRRKVDGG